MSSAPLDELIATLGDQMVVTDPNIWRVTARIVPTTRRPERRWQW